MKKTAVQSNLLDKKSCEQIQLAEFSIDVIRSKRKSVSLQIKQDNILIRAPHFAPQLALKAFALSKIEWLRKHHKRLIGQPTFKKPSFASGETFLYRGDDITLQIANNKSSAIFFNPLYKTLTITVGSRVKHHKPFIQKQLIQWYKDELLRYLEEATPQLANKMNIQYRKITTKDYKARWGSCSADGELSFNWRIMMAPEAVINSVIVHELAHIKHFNHSKQFWSLVYQHYPNYKQQHNWLKNNQYRLNI